MDNNNLISNEISYENIYEDVFNVASSVIMKIEEKDIIEDTANYYKISTEYNRD